MEADHNCDTKGAHDLNRDGEPSEGSIGKIKPTDGTVSDLDSGSKSRKRRRSATPSVNDTASASYVNTPMDICGDTPGTTSVLDQEHNVEDPGDDDSGTTRKRRRYLGTPVPNSAITVEPSSNEKSVISKATDDSSSNPPLTSLHDPATSCDIPDSFEEQTHVMESEPPPSSSNSSHLDRNFSASSSENINATPSIARKENQHYSELSPTPARSLPSSPLFKPILLPKPANSDPASLLTTSMPYVYPYPLSSSPKSGSSPEHQYQSWAASHMYYYHLQSQYPATSQSLYQNQRHNSLNLYHIDSHSPLDLTSLQSQPSPNSEPKIQTPHTEANSKALVHEPTTESLKLTSSTVENGPVPSSIILRNADALLELLAEELKESQVKHQHHLSTVNTTHQANMSRLNAKHAVELACLENALCRKEAEVEERLNSTRTSVLAVEQLKSKEILRHAKSEMQAAHQLQLEDTEGRIKEECREELEKLAVQAKESSEKAMEVEERLKELEAKLEEAAGVYDEEIAQWKADEERWKRECDQKALEMRKQWDEEKRQLEGCIEEERAKRLDEEVARKNVVKEEVTRKRSTQEQLARRMSAEQEKNETGKMPVNADDDEPKSWKGLEGVRMFLEEDDGITQAEIDKELAREQKRFTRAHADLSSAAGKTAAATAPAAFRKLDEEKKLLETDKQLLVQQTAKLDEEKRKFEDVKRRLEAWTDEFKTTTLRQNERDKQEWEEAKRRQEQLIKAGAEKDRKEAETTGYQQAMARMQQRMNDWQNTTAKELEDAKEAIARERDILSKEKELLEEEKREVARRELEDKAKLQEAEKLRIQTLNDLWAKEIEDRWAKLAETKKKEQERREREDEETQRDREIQRYKNDLKAMEDKVKLLENSLREQEESRKETPAPGRENTDIWRDQARSTLERILSEGPNSTSEWNRRPEDPCYQQ